jgi:hypothetical protein
VTRQCTDNALGSPVTLNARRGSRRARRGTGSRGGGERYSAIEPPTGWKILLAVHVANHKGSAQTGFCSASGTRFTTGIRCSLTSSAACGSGATSLHGHGCCGSPMNQRPSAGRQGQGRRASLAGRVRRPMHADTIQRWYRELIARKYDGSTRR